MLPTPTIPHATIRPESRLAVLSAAEANDLCAAQNETVYGLFRRCALAVLTSNYGTGQSVIWVQGRDLPAWERPERRSCPRGP